MQYNVPPVYGLQQPQAPAIGYPSSGYFVHAPGGNGQLPGGNGQLPGGNGQLPGGNGQLPGGNGQLPGSNGQLPAGIIHPQVGPLLPVIPPAPDKLGFFAKMARTGTTMLAPSSLNANDGIEVDPALVFTGRFCGGLRDDLKRRAPHYISDWTDALKSENRSQSLACVIFLFFACISPALTFGLLFQELTDGEMGVIESLLSTGVFGIIYAFFSGQPISIVGMTGPEYAYTIVTWNLCKQMGIPFLAGRWWQGMWCAALTILLAGFDLCFLMKYVTRFTEEIFASFITITFILGAFLNVLKLYEADSSPIGRARAFGGTILFLGTYSLATSLKSMKGGVWLNPSLRAMCSNYGIVIAILLFSGLNAVFRDVGLATLNVPSKFEPTWVNPATNKTRSWIIDPMGTPEHPMEGWAIGFMILPAFGLMVLGYMDQNVSTLIVNRKDHKLTKGSAYHIDLMLCGVIFYPISSIFGIPFPHASTVPCLIHLISLTNRETVQLEGGGTTTRVVSVIEGARTTNLLIHVLILLSLTFTSILKFVPRTVLFGVFLFMGVGSIAGNDLFDRIKLFAIWVVTDFPQYEYTKKVTVKAMHTFTLLQLVLLVLLYLSTLVNDLGIVFPFFIASLIPLRWVLNRFWNPEDLKWLDK